jgi:hypothetical protein
MPFLSYTKHSSDWISVNYSAKAKADFQLKLGILFDHNIVQNMILSTRYLPKNKIATANNINAQFTYILFYLNNNGMHALEVDVFCIASKCPVAEVRVLLCPISN